MEDRWYFENITDPPGFEPGPEAPEASILSRLYYESNSLYLKMLEYIGGGLPSLKSSPT